MSVDGCYELPDRKLLSQENNYYSAVEEKLQEIINLIKVSWRWISFFTKLVLIYESYITFRYRFYIQL